MRWALVGLLVVHGLIHVLGFLKTWQLAALPQLSGATLVALSAPLTKPIGGPWLLTCGLFLSCAIALVARFEARWVLGVAAVIPSQLLKYNQPLQRTGVSAQVDSSAQADFPARSAAR
jgi:hypothetical protein